MSKSVAKAEEAKLPATAQENQLPAFMEGKAGAGTDNLSTSDMEVPRIKLVQAISPEITEYDTVKAGEFWHTLAEQSLGKSLRIVPVYTDKRYILWRPRKAGGGILARADDGVHWNPANTTFEVTLPETKKSVKWTTKDTVQESGLADWGSYDPTDANSQPAATLMYTFVVALPDHPDLGFAQLTLQRGAVSVARSLIGKIKINKAPSYGRVFKMDSVEDSNSSNDPFFNYRFTAEGYVQNQDHFNAYEALYKQFAQTGLNIKDIETLQGGADTEAPVGKSNKDF